MKVELLAPCHDWPTLIAAVEAGANAVYFGVQKYNMRLKANNFTTKELPKIVKYCHEKKVKAYLTLNSIIYEDELKKVEIIIKIAKKAKIDAIIIHDLGLIPILKKHKQEFHISTQASVSNSNSANVYKKLGASRVILARETNIKQVKKIVKNSKIGIEIFIHGAMCVSVSGRCFFSHTLTGKSANRGECTQPCRQKWKVTNQDNKLIYDGERFLNAKDLCTLPIIDKLLKLGVTSFKIEGRRKDANYVSTVVKVYKEAINDFKKSKVKKWMTQLETVYNRGFSTGFYLGIPGIKDIETKEEGTTATTRKVAVGIIKNYYPKVSAAKAYLNHTNLKVGDEIIIEGKTTFLKQKIESIEINNKKINKAEKKQVVAIKVKQKVRKNDQVYKIKKV